MPRWMNRTLLMEVSTGIQTSIKDICPSWQNVVKRCRSSVKDGRKHALEAKRPFSQCDPVMQPKCNTPTFCNTEGHGITGPKMSKVRNCVIGGRDS